MLCSPGFLSIDSPDFDNPNLNYNLAVDMNLNNNEAFIIPSHGLYPDYTYKELTEISDLVVMGQFIYFDEARWSTSDGKQPNGVKITKAIDGDGYEYIDFVLDIGDETIYTDSVFQINEYFKGKTDSEKIVIRLFSGTVDMLQAVEHEGLNADDYKENKPIVFYLEQSKNKTEDGLNYYVIVTPKGALSVEDNILINSYGEKLTFEEIKSF